MATVTYRDATRLFDKSARPAVDKLNLDIRDGEFLVLVGPSGCGKTTSLRMLAGLESVDAGTIEIGGRDVSGLGPRDRDIAMVFQSYALYPHMTVAENMGFALKIAGVSKAQIATRVQEAARILDLDEYLSRKPRELSGGQRQRVAMGRAIVREPQVFLMDEPLSNLDAKLRVSTRAEIAALQKRLAVTTVYVTHDQVEAMTMGDRVAVLKDGVLQQCDTPRTLYNRPVNDFVAGFIGSPAMNLVRAELSPDSVVIAGTAIPLEPSLRSAVAGRTGMVTAGFRPEAVRIAPGATGLPMTVTLVEELGAEVLVYGTLALNGNGDGGSVIVRADVSHAPARQAAVNVEIAPDRLHLFDVDSGARIG